MCRLIRLWTVVHASKHVHFSMQCNVLPATDFVRHTTLWKESDNLHTSKVDNDFALLHWIENCLLVYSIQRRIGLLSTQHAFLPMFMTNWTIVPQKWGLLLNNDNSHNLTVNALPIQTSLHLFWTSLWVSSLHATYPLSLLIPLYKLLRFSITVSLHPSPPLHQFHRCFLLKHFKLPYRIIQWGHSHHSHQNYQYKCYIVNNYNILQYTCTYRTDCQ